MASKVIRMVHVRKAGLCSRGAREFAATMNLDWNDFLVNGLAIDIVRSWNDAIANKVADIAEADEDNK